MDASGATDQPEKELSSAESGPSASFPEDALVHVVYRVQENGRMVYKSEIISIGALADRGANGCIVGRDMTIISVSDVRIDLSGLDEHTVRELSIVHAACVIESQNGPVITHWPQQASMPDSKSVLSTVQMEAHGCIVNDKPMKVTGEQPFIQSPDGYKFPLKTRQGLMYLDCRPVRDDEWEKMPHTYMCSDTPWDPRVYDGEVDKSWFGKQEETVDKKLEDMPYNKYGVMDSETATTVVDEFSDDDDNEGITLREVEINLTKLIEDELVDSVIEINVDGEIYQRHLNDDDLTCEWGDWEDHSAVNWQCYDVQGRRLLEAANLWTILIPRDIGTRAHLTQLRRLDPSRHVPKKSLLRLLTRIIPCHRFMKKTKTKLLQEQTITTRRSLQPRMTNALLVPILASHLRSTTPTMQGILEEYRKHVLKRPSAIQLNLVVSLHLMEIGYGEG